MIWMMNTSHAFQAPIRPETRILPSGVDVTEQHLLEMLSLAQA